MQPSVQSDTQVGDVTGRSLDRIVVGIDFTAESLAAAQWVGRHLGREATLMLAHVIDDPLLPNVLGLRSGRRAESDGPFRARMQSLRGALRGLAGVIGGGETRIEVRVGDPALQLAAYADIVEADLIVVGGNAVFHAEPYSQTATTDRLLRHLARPGLVVRDALARPATVLAVLCENIEAPVRTVARMVASRCGARVAAIRLPDRTAAGSEESVVHSLGDVARHEQARSILDAARTLRADVIVIGSRTPARGADDDLARMLARTATCAVLVVPLAAGPPPRPAASVRETDDAA